MEGDKVRGISGGGRKRNIDNDQNMYTCFEGVALRPVVVVVGNE